MKNKNDFARDYIPWIVAFVAILVLADVASYYMHLAKTPQPQAVAANVTLATAANTGGTAALSPDFATALALMQDQYSNHMSNLSMILTLVVAAFALFSILLPIFNYSFQKEQLDKINKQFAENKADIEEAKKELKTAKKDLEAAKEDLDKTKSKLDEQSERLNKAIEEANEELKTAIAEAKEHSNNAVSETKKQLKEQSTRFNNSMGQNANFSIAMSDKSFSSDNIRPISDSDYDKAVAYSFRGYIEKSRKNYKKAISNLEIATNLERKNVSYWALLGDVFFNDDQYSKSAVAYQKCIELDDTVTNYHACLCLAFYQMGEFDEAEKAIRKAVELAPEEILYNKTLSDIQKAKAAQQAALSTAPESCDGNAD